jgi:multiple sugar transport system permease protein
MSIPMELEEAVRIDGGGAYRCFFQIILPLTKPALATLGTFVFLFFWNNFLWPLLVTNSTEMFTLPMGIQLFTGRFTAQWHLMMAASTMAMLPMIIVYLFAQKYFVEGIAMTGLKA